MGWRGKCAALIVWSLVLQLAPGCHEPAIEAPTRPFEWPDEASREEMARARRAVEAKAFDALRAGDVRTVEALLESHPGIATAIDPAPVTRGSGPVTGGYPSLLHLALKKRHYELAARLIDAGADVTRRDAEGLAPLHHAAVPGGEEIVKRLLAGGASPNAMHPEAGTPLQRAVLNGARGVVAMLLDSGADPSAENEAGLTPLRCAGLDVGLHERLLRERVTLTALDKSLIGIGLSVCANEYGLRIGDPGPAAKAWYEERLAEARAIANGLWHKRPAGEMSSWWRRCTEASPYRLRRGLPLPPLGEWPVHTAVWEADGEAYLVCINYHTSMGFGDHYYVVAFDGSMKLVRTGELNVGDDDEPYGLVEVRIASEALPASLRNRWLLAVLTLDRYGTFDQRMPVAVKTRDEVEASGVNRLSAILVEWFDAPSVGAERQSWSFRNQEIEVRWAESGPSRLADRARGNSRDTAP